MKLGLERFAEFCARLGNPQDKFRSVHIGGTNGKGSTTAMVASILHAAGYKVGSYYSPFVHDIRERFLLNGEMISEGDFARLVEFMRPIAKELEQTEHGHPTEFELKTALAFLWFAENKVDFAVLEVGLGGRLDATNIVNPLVCAITNVGMDHMDHLGDTIVKIAAEKAGIIKPNGRCVTAAEDPRVLEVIRRTSGERNSVLWRVLKRSTDDYAIIDGMQPPTMECEGLTSLFPCPAACSEQSEVKPSHSTGALCVTGMHCTYKHLRLAMRGQFQNVNATLAIGVVEVLQEQGVSICEAAIRAGLESARLPGRMEIIREKPMVVLDGAHNPDAARKLAEALERDFEYDKLVLIMGMVKGHSVEDVVSILAPLADKFIATAPSDPRAAPASEVEFAARKYCSDVSVIEPVPDAVRHGLESAGDDDMILVTGSFYTIGETPR